jgi:hypothetical protein
MLLLTANPVANALDNYRTIDDIRIVSNVVGEIAVEVVQIDQLVDSRQLPPPTLVKIDVEGADYAIMQGMAHTLNRFQPKIVYEVDGECEEAARIREGQIERFLSKMGYKIRRLDDCYSDTSRYVAHFLAQARASLGASQFAWLASAIAAG